MRKDLAHAVRVLWKSPRFTATALIVLALGIGANSAMFSLVYSVLLRPLPYQDSGRIAVIMATAEHGDAPFSVPPAVYLDFRQRTRTFATMAAAELWSPSLTGSGEAEELHGMRATSAIFDVFGVGAARGRTFLPEDERPGATRVVVLAASLWKRRFGGEASAVGRTITLNREPATIVGVLPDSFYFPPFWGRDTEIYTPLPRTPRWEQDRVISTLRTFARLKPGVSWDEARADIRGVGNQLAREYPSQAKTTAMATPVLEMSVGKVRTSLMILFGAVGCTLLIACANLANLFLARGASRRKEAAIRQALGASRFALARHMLAESLVLSFAGGVLGLFAAWAAVSAFLAGMPAAGFHMPRESEISIGPAVIVFHLLVCAAAGLLFGLAPALRAAHVDLEAALKESARGSTGGGRGLRGVLVASEVALALMLLAGASLLLQSFRKLQDLPAGFDPQGMLAVNLAVAGSDHARAERRAAFYREAVDQFRGLPGVTEAGAVNHVPLAGDVFRMPIVVEGMPKPAPGDEPSAIYRVALPGYFRAAGMRIERGREFTEHDDEGSVQVAVINQTMARHLWPGADAIGRRFRLSSSSGPTPWYEVAGILRDTRQWTWSANAENEMYLPYLQDGAYRHGGANFLTMTLVLRTTAAPEMLAPLIRERIRAIDPNVPITSILPMRQVVDDAVWLPRLEMSVLTAMAALALVLATVGIYAVVSYLVSGRTQEIGIRVALGAAPRAVAQLVMRQSLAPVAIGAALGLGGIIALGRWMRALLFEVDPLDPATLLGVTAVLVAIALAAALAPARRASRIDPMRALRS